MFYNDLQKKRYLENCKYEPTTIERIEIFFDNVSKIENQFGLDLAEFNRLQVVDMFKSFNSRSRHYLVFIASVFSNYYSWCLEEGLVDITNVTNWYDISLSKSIIEEAVPIELVKDRFFTRDDVINDFLPKIQDPTNKFYLYATFRCVRGENNIDISHLRMEDLDEERKEVTLISGRVQKVDDLFIELMKEASEQTHYYPDGIVKYNKFNRNEYDESEYILKFCRNGSKDVPVTKQVLTARMTVIKKQVENKFVNGDTLYRNGLINYLKEYYENKGIDLKTALNDKINGKLYTYDKETEEVLQSCGSSLTARMLRLQLKDVLDFYL